jgi:AcrR family transcriptional regulator
VGFEEGRVGNEVGAAEQTAPVPKRDRRQLRHQATRQEILETAWRMVRADGLAALSLSTLARAVGMEPQSLYTYFSSKHAVYDAMFAEANADLLHRMRAIEWPEEPREMLRQQARLFVEFSAEDPARHQLLFERTIPDFSPSPESYALALDVFATARARQARAGLTDDAHFDLWTALVAGLAVQQSANDPGGDRWIRLIDEAVDMYADHVFNGYGGGQSGRG